VEPSTHLVELLEEILALLFVGEAGVVARVGEEEPAEEVGAGEEVHAVHLEGEVVGVEEEEVGVEEEEEDHLEEEVAGVEANPTFSVCI